MEKWWYEIADWWIDREYRGVSKGTILCVDFDGVIHAYGSGWQGPRTIPDPPVIQSDGGSSIQWLEYLVSEGWCVCIYSARNRYAGGIAAIKKWLYGNGMRRSVLVSLRFPKQKPPAYLTIDDRAHLFEGQFLSTADLRAFQTWNRVN